MEFGQTCEDQVAFFRRLILDLGYQQLGGGGLTWQPESVENLAISDALAYQALLRQYRKQDHDNAKKAAGK